MKKKVYEKPEIEVLVVQFEDALLTVSGGGNITDATEEDYDVI